MGAAAKCFCFYSTTALCDFTKNQGGRHQENTKEKKMEKKKQKKIKEICITMRSPAGKPLSLRDLYLSSISPSSLGKKKESDQFSKF